MYSKKYVSGGGLEPIFTPAAFDKQVLGLMALITKTPRESFALRALSAPENH